MSVAVAVAYPNIALIKYWGDRDADLHLPVNGSISMNLAGLTARSQASLEPRLAQDELILNGERVGGDSLVRMIAFLDRVRALAGVGERFQVVSANNFPTAAGIASSAAAFAALSLAATAACGLRLEEAELSRLARLGSGSACRSVPGGFVEWHMGVDHASSYATSFAPPEHWDLRDHIALVSEAGKAVSSRQGHLLASSSPLQEGRLRGVTERLGRCRSAILAKDFAALAEVVEQDSLLMHAVMMTSSPPLFYWAPATLRVLSAVRQWRSEGAPVCATIDAGPNVHVLAPGEWAEWVVEQLQGVPGVKQVLSAAPGGPAHLEM
ncbi:MAG: diphosphomevalonate decarboxylase [Anaerolineales bacterium]|nr:diphosphomevalonate decarboxylase [Anaerolineales bacterium]